MDVILTIDINRSSFFVLSDIERIACYSYADRKERELPKWLLVNYGPGVRPAIETYLTQTENMRQMRNAHNEYMKDCVEYEKRYRNFIEEWNDGAIDRILPLEFRKTGFLSNIECYKTAFQDDVDADDVIAAAIIIPELVPYVLKCGPGRANDLITGNIIVKGKDAHTVVRFLCDVEGAHIEKPETIRFAIPENFSGLEFSFQKMKQRFIESRDKDAYDATISHKGKKAAFTFAFDKESGESKESALLRELVFDCATHAKNFSEWSRRNFGYIVPKYDSGALDMSLMYERKKNNIKGIGTIFGNVKNFLDFVNAEIEKDEPSATAAPK